MNDSLKNDLNGRVAVVGLAGRFPGARNIHEFWQNLKNGVESITRFRAEDLEEGSRELLANPNYVKARSVLDNVDLFDAAFFEMYPKEAEITDPQHRIFLECAWEALEDAGCDPQTYKGAIGVFAGCSMNTYFLSKLCARPGYIEGFANSYQVGSYPELVGNGHDFLATRVSYKLNLRGPSFTLQAGCATSLLAICQAYQSLITYQSDMALAGGVSITFPQNRGYLYQEDGMVSPDGHCRTFDAKAKGTVFGSGVGAVALKRLEDALADGDHIYAVIRGLAVNNDGSAKVGYAAPSVEGQSSVIATAHASADVSADTISYVEAHGTGTPLGDPIEVAALTKAFRATTEAKNFCALGSAKPNVGHLDVAAGVTGFIKTVLALHHKMLPPMLHFEQPNPKMDLAGSPFYVNKQLKPWVKMKMNGVSTRRAGVSAFGVGGTNAHVVLEEAPQQPPSHELSQEHLPQLILLSARTESALDQAALNLAAHLKSAREVNLADVAYTLQAGRRHFEFRRIVVCDGLNDAIATLEAPRGKGLATGKRRARKPSIAFMFPGQGAQYAGMGAELYQREPVFRKHIDRCAQVLTPALGVDLRTLLFPSPEKGNEAEQILNQTLYAQPAIFTIAYSLAQLWMHWGVRPQAMVGHSVGEFVAACLAGVMSADDALGLIVERARLMQSLSRGSMLSVRLPVAELRDLLGEKISVAAVNSPRLTVAAGPDDAIQSLEAELRQKGIACRRLRTSHAFHSQMVDPILEPFADRVRRVKLNPPLIPYVSCVTGKWITAEDAQNPSYWALHCRKPVMFSDAIQCLADVDVLLEVGPGSTLEVLARQALPEGERTVVPSLSDPSSTTSESKSIRNALGRLWISGAEPNWKNLHGEARVQKVSLPTYPFERKRYWLSSPAKGTTPVAEASSAMDQQTLEGTPQMKQADTAVPSRLERITPILASIFEELTGLKAAEIPGNAGFLDLGFDSLLLTQVSQAVQTKFEVKVTFRQLLDQQSTLDALAVYLDQNLPAGAFAPEPSPAPPSVSVQSSSLRSEAVASSEPAATNGNSSIAVGDSVAERIVKEQLHAMSQLMAAQLEVLKTHNGTAPAKSLPAAESTAVPAPASTAQAVKGGEAAPVAGDQAATKPEFKAFGPYKPVQQGTRGQLTARQEKYLSGLITRYIKRTAESKRLTQAYRQPFADPRVVAGFRSQWKEIVYPIVTVRSAGSKLWDVDGNEYIDILNGYGPTMFGHAPRFVTDAVAEQLKLGFEIGPQSPLAGKVAKLISEFTAMERVTFCNTGSEAVMAALRLARTVTGRNKIVMFAGSYHGTFDEVLVKGVNKPGAPRSVPIAPGIPKEKVANVYVLDYGTSESLAFIKEHAKELAAVLVEPVQSRHPALQPKEFLEAIRKVTLESQTALIFDEVVTGFRSHPGGVQAIFGIRADMATYGKVLAGGLPIGVLAGCSKFMDALDGGCWSYGDESYPETGVTFFAGTFVRHPLAMAATLAVLNHLKAEGPQLQQQLTDKTSKLVHVLNEFCEQNGVPTRIETFASIFYFSFPSDLRFASLFYYHMREKGIHIQEGFPCFLTTAHTDADIERVIRAFKESIKEMQAGEALPAPSAFALQEESVPDALQQRVVAATEVPCDAPLTEAQMEVWLSAQLSPEASCSYNESFSLRMNGRLNQDFFRQSLQEIVDRHDALRARFSPSGDRLLFTPDLRLSAPLIDFSSQSCEAEENLRDFIEADAKTPFDLTEGPLVRAAIVKLGEERHVLVFTAHHIVCDGWSVNVILDELSKIYSAKCRGVAGDLARAMQFADYARQHAKQAGSAETLKAEAYWLNQFANLPPALELPLDRPRAALKTYAGATHRWVIEKEAYRKIKRAGAQLGCTLFATLLAGFDALLYRLTSQEDVVVGIPTAGQSLVEGASLVGHCVNFLPVRERLTGATAAADLLVQVKRSVLDAYEHQNYTFGTLVRKLPITRDPSRLPLVEVQFNLEHVGAKLDLPGLRVEVDPNPKTQVNFDLFVNVVESEDGLVIDCDYNTDLFDEATIAQWMNCYQTLLQGIAEDPRRPVAAFPLLRGQELEEAVHARNNTRTDYPNQQTIHGLFAEQAARTPDAVALEFEGQQLTYVQLEKKANRLAGYLRKLGVGPDILVGLLADRSTEMVIGLLGVLKAGGAYVPMDPTYPKDRIAFILNETKTPVLLTLQRLAGQVDAGSARVVCLDADWPSIEGEAASPVDTAVKPENLAYVIYTSGSTGQPKGAEISHRSVVNLLCAMQKAPGLTAQDTLLAVTTLSFDIAGLELYLPLITGARLVVATRETASDGTQLLAKIRSTGATVLQATPITWRLLLEAGWKGDPQLAMLCGGEALPRDLADQLLATGCRLWNMYGPTETTIWSSALEVQPGQGPVPLGPPIANTQFYVLDSAGQPVPNGVPGELHIGGDGLARGYFQRPQLTGEKFVANPFGQSPDDRLYKTGDLVRSRPNGTLEFLGRLDHQVKLRGFRVELGEIESILVRHPKVSEAVVIIREDRPGEKRVVGYLVTTDGAALDSSELRSFLASKLPDYMIPAAFVQLAVLPLTDNGKINRRTLPAPDWKNPVCAKEFVAPRSEHEQTLANIWAEVLHLERVGAYDNIFELGADSLHMFQIAARANKAGLHVTPKLLLQHRTIAAVVAEMGTNGNGNGNGNGAKPVAPAITPVSRERFRVTASQSKG